MVHSELVKITMDVSKLAREIIDIVMRYHSFSKSIISGCGSLFTSKFCSLLYYFFGLKYILSTTFHSQTNTQTERQNSMIEVYLLAFINWEQNDWARLLSMAKFIYNNSKNASIGHIPFKLNCG